MASGRNAAHTAEAERLADVADRPAHQWEVGDADSWEASVTDTWNPPASGSPVEASGSPREASGSPGEAQVGETELRETEARPAELPAERSVPPAVPPGDRAVRSARQALDEALRLAGPGTETAAPEMDPARMAVSLASLAAERMRAGVPAGDGLVTGFGLARQTANGLLALGQRLLEPASRIAASAVQGAARLPVAGPPVRAALRSGQWLARSGAQAREKLRASLEGVRRPDHETADSDEAGPAAQSTNDSPERTSGPGAGAATSRP